MTGDKPQSAPSGRGEPTSDGSVARAGSIWRRAFRGQLPLWKVFWLAFVPALLLIYLGHGAILTAVARYQVPLDLELVSITWSLVSLLALMAIAVTVWRCAFNSRGKNWRHLAPLLAALVVMGLGYQIVSWTFFYGTLFARDTPRVKAARDFALCSSLYWIAARSSSTEEEKTHRNREATSFYQDAIILTNKLFASSEQRRAYKTIARELETSADLEKWLVAQAKFCDDTKRMHHETLMQRIRQINAKLRPQTP